MTNQASNTCPMGAACQQTSQGPAVALSDGSFTTTISTTTTPRQAGTTPPSSSSSSSSSSSPMEKKDDRLEEKSTPNVTTLTGPPYQPHPSPNNPANEAAAQSSPPTNRAAPADQATTTNNSQAHWARLLAHLPEEANFFRLRVEAKHLDCQGLMPTYTHTGDLPMDETGRVVETSPPRYQPDYNHPCDTLNVAVEIDTKNTTLRGLCEVIVGFIEADTAHQDAVHCASTVIKEMEVVVPAAAGGAATFSNIMAGMSDAELRVVLYRIRHEIQREAYLTCMWEY